MNRYIQGPSPYLSLWYPFSLRVCVITVSSCTPLSRSEAQVTLVHNNYTALEFKLEGKEYSTMALWRRKDRVKLYLGRRTCSTCLHGHALLFQRWLGKNEMWKHFTKEVMWQIRSSQLQLLQTCSCILLFVPPFVLFPLLVHGLYSISSMHTLARWLLSSLKVILARVPVPDLCANSLLTYSLTVMLRYLCLMTNIFL